MRKRIRLTEGQLHRVIKESVKKVLNEEYKYMIVTYDGETVVDRTIVFLSRPGLTAYDDEVPFSLGSNQALIELD